MEYVPSGGTDYKPYIERLLAQRPDAVYTAAITGDAVTLVEQGLGLGLFAKTSVFGTMDYGTLAAMAKAPVGAEGYTEYPSAAIYDTPFARELQQSLGTGVANGGAAGDGFDQIEVIAQGIEKAGSTDPAKVRDGLAGATVQTVQGDVRVTAATTSSRCRSRWARSQPRPERSPSRTSNRYAWSIPPGTPNADRGRRSRLPTRPRSGFPGPSPRTGAFPARPRDTGRPEHVARRCRRVR